MKRTTWLALTALTLLVVVAPASAASNDESFRLDLESARDFVTATDGAKQFAAGYVWALRDRWSADHKAHAECATSVGVDFLMEMIASASRKDYGGTIKVTKVVSGLLEAACAEDAS